MKARRPQLRGGIVRGGNVDGGHRWSLARREARGSQGVSDFCASHRYTSRGETFIIFRKKAILYFLEVTGGFYVEKRV